MKNSSLSLLLISVNIITYSGFSIHDGTLLHPKSQYTTVKHSRKLSEHTHVHVRPARSRNTHAYRILPTGPLVAISQHSLPFLQSEGFQTHVGTIHRRAIGPLSDRVTSAYSPSLTCHLPAPTIECLHRPPFQLTCSSRPTYTHVCGRPISRPDCSLSGIPNTIVACVLLLRS
jgi:hypothetical protein